MAPPIEPRATFIPNRIATTPGSPPGMLTPQANAERPQLRLIEFNETTVSDKCEATVESITNTDDDSRVIWVDVVGLADVELISDIGEQFGLHSLALEDVVNVHQRAKADVFDDHLFIVCRMPVANSSTSEQVAIFLGRNFVLSFQERPGDCFGPIRRRLLDKNSRIRNAGADYLTYALLDAIVDSYFPELERLGERVDALEDDIVHQAKPTQAAAIHTLKRELLALRRAIWPLREMVNGLLRDETTYVRDSTKLYLRDCYDHTVHLMDMVETYREVIFGLVDLHLSSINTNMNEVMKVLTVIATIFIPLSFIASVFGMNFDPDTSPWNMPEMRWYFGYPLALLLMVLVATGLLGFFRWRGWFGTSITREQSNKGL